MSRASCCEMHCCISASFSAVSAFAAVWAVPCTLKASKPAAAAVSCETIASSTWDWSAMAPVRATVRERGRKSLNTREPVLLCYSKEIQNTYATGT